jgi:hypothetical protein
MKKFHVTFYTVLALLLWGSTLFAGHPLLFYNGGVHPQQLVVGGHSPDWVNGTYNLLGTYEEAGYTESVYDNAGVSMYMGYSAGTANPTLSWWSGVDARYAQHVYDYEGNLLPAQSFALNEQSENVPFDFSNYYISFDGGGFGPGYGVDPPPTASSIVEFIGILVNTFTPIIFAAVALSLAVSVVAVLRRGRR